MGLWNCEITRVPGISGCLYLYQMHFSHVGARVWLVYEWYTAVGFIQSSGYICILYKKAPGELENQSFWFLHSILIADCALFFIDPIHEYGSADLFVFARFSDRIFFSKMAEGKSSWGPLKLAARRKGIIWTNHWFSGVNSLWNFQGE